jgi:pyridoxal phosphate enzyme (YggS family)
MTEPAARVEAYRAARERVLARIEDACARVGRDSARVSLVAVSKTVSADALRDAVAAGLDRLGENRVQEGVAKVPEVPGARWELVGPLQSNKARRALQVFDSIQTVDSVELGRRLDRLVPEVRPGGRYPVLVQVNVDEDPAKAGFAAADLDGALPDLLGLPHLAVRGLMTVGRLTGDDFELAVEEGATIVRVGRALFGERPHAHEPHA